jgi:Flp pilus assembly protein TadD
MTTIATRSKLERARAHQQAGRVKRAKDLYHQILREDPVCTEALFNLALMFCDAGELATAVEYFQRLIAQDPDLPDVHFNLGTVLARLGRAEEAVKAYVQAIALQPEMADAYNNLGILLRDCGQDEQALVCFDQALNHAPTLLAPRVNFVTTLVRLHRPDEAIEAARRAVEQFPSSGEAHNVLGLALDCAGRWDEAVVSLHEAIRLKPDADVWRYFLAARGGSSAPESAPSQYVASLFNRYAERFDEHLVNVLQYRVPDHLLDAVAKTAHGRLT